MVWSVGKLERKHFDQLKVAMKLRCYVLFRFRFTALVSAGDLDYQSEA